MSKFKIICPGCGCDVRIPKLWSIGVETVFLCPECKRRFKTGYKMGAVLNALGLTLALVTVNLGAWLFSSYSIPLMVLAIAPLWLIYSFSLRRWWLVRTSQNSKKGKSKSRKKRN